jgi:DNA-binding XRE family transcriptional regulator/molybdate-binding protein
MFGARIRALRREQGLTQAQLAELAGVSRQLVGAVEAGRHLPRVDAAVALGRVLGEPVEALLVPVPAQAHGVVTMPPDGRPVRVARVGERLVCHPAAPGGESWAPADGVVRDGRVELFDALRPGVVVAGCDPAIGLVARLVERHTDTGVLAVAVSTASAVGALAGGTVHAAIVHGPPGKLPAPPCAVRRVQVARWRVGLVGAPGLADRWWADALDGRLPVVQREQGAGSQDEFERAVLERGAVPQAAGPRARGHLEAAALAARHGCAAVSIEPAARALGLAFHPLREHMTELWVAADHVDVPGVRRFADELTGSRLRRLLDAVGGYDLAGCGREVAA